MAGWYFVWRLQCSVLNLQVVQLALIVLHKAFLVEVLVYRMIWGTNRQGWNVLTIVATLPSLALFSGLILRFMLARHGAGAPLTGTCPHDIDGCRIRGVAGWSMVIVCW